MSNVKGCPIEHNLIHKIIAMKDIFRKSENRQTIYQVLKKLEELVHKEVKECPFLEE